ncbi:hypothetical protein CIRG_03921 [Coccidioides immitis RMSCC 2394]|uniref:Uncharacterized protein n=1 Tax=Coccidioides immitis RMSCC 2394 TaxID=404692 RepID=A0A0J6Y926_COCIT|nr:hypothetical protein CIRG_03921 [Coccidioides immitis RMSCC 2394]
MAWSDCNRFLICIQRQKQSLDVGVFRPLDKMYSIEPSIPINIQELCQEVKSICL